MTKRRGMPLGRLLVPALALGAVGLTSGCASAEADGAVAAAARFMSAMGPDGAHEWEGACLMLAPSTRAALEQEGDGDCARGLESASSDLSPAPAAVPVDRVEVAGATALVELAGEAGGGVVFLARFDDGWRVAAAGCRPPADGGADEPMDCVVEGD